MPSVVFPQGGDIKLLGVCKSYLQSCKWRIFINNHTPTETDTSGTFTDAANIADVTLSWGSIAINGSGKAQMDLTGNFLFTQTVATTQTAYGLFGVDPSDGTLVAAALFTTSIGLVNNGDSVQLTQFTVTLSDFC